MKIVTINQTLLKEFQKDPEVLRKTARPCVLIIRLKYKDVSRSFAVPLRSNISAHTPKDQYFALPTRSSTHTGNHHGLHYIQRFPVIKKLPFRMKSEGSRRYQKVCVHQSDYKNCIAGGICRDGMVQSQESQLSIQRRIS